LLLICKGSLRLRRLLHNVGIKSLASLNVWRLAPGPFHQLMRSKEPYLANLTLPSHVNVDTNTSDAADSVQPVAVDEDLIVSMLGTVKAFVDKFSWAKDIYFDDDESNDDNKDGDTVPEEDADDCQYLAHGESQCGVRVRVSMGDGWWEDGTVVGYIPADPASQVPKAEASNEGNEDDNGPLWRVCLDVDGKDDPSRSCGGMSTTEYFLSQQGRVKSYFQAAVRSSVEAVRVEDLNESELNASLATFRRSGGV
jgi:hypothetical protein